MSRGQRFGLLVAGVLALAAGSVAAQEREHGNREGAQNHEQGSRESDQARPAPREAEAHPGPRGYQRPSEPRGWNARPANADRGAYQHNYQAARAYHVGPYHPPAGWSDRRWAYGQILPRAFWGSEYFLADYWLFGLEVPPSGYEWIRSGSDALLIDTNSGEILQVEYGVFA